jgi:hypothetical protein
LCGHLSACDLFTPPERWLRALLPQAFNTIRSETQLIEQLDCNLLYRWFVGLAGRRAGMGADDVHEEPRTHRS